MTRFFLGCLSLILVAAAPAYADKNDITIEQFREAGAGSYIDASYAYAVFPSIGKGGVIVGGAQGEGTVFQGGQAIGEVKMNQLTVGLQFGGRPTARSYFLRMHARSGSLRLETLSSALRQLRLLSIRALVPKPVLVVVPEPQSMRVMTMVSKLTAEALSTVWLFLRSRRAALCSRPLSAVSATVTARFR